MIAIALVLIGAAMTLPLVLGRTDTRPELIDRLAFTFIGIVMLAWWVLPFDTLEPVIGHLDSDIEMFFVSGIAMVAAAVWTVMYNADLLLRAITFLTSGIGKLRPVLVTAVAYPMSAKFRTGLTLAMFALVIFTLIVVSILTEAFSTTSDRVALATGGWDIEGTIAPGTPIADIGQAIDDNPALSADSFRAVGGYTAIPFQARQVGAESHEWQWYRVRAADDRFLAKTEYKIKLISDGYGPSSRDVWEALRRDPSLVVVDATVVPSRDEAFGLVALEAALMASPVVATRVGGLPEIVVHNETGILVSNGDSEAMADAIEHLFTHPEAAAAMGRAARERVIAEFNWQDNVEAYDTLYRQMGTHAGKSMT
ncbi:MAG: glycosyltransferase family 4 protein, partial [Acidobacteria bacterium]|nr:glycosyltransferase family 4 protein [Acidobacteriota bacterium]